MTENSVENELKNTFHVSESSLQQRQGPGESFQREIEERRVNISLKWNEKTLGLHFFIITWTVLQIYRNGDTDMVAGLICQLSLYLASLVGYYSVQLERWSIFFLYPAYFAASWSLLQSSPSWSTLLIPITFLYYRSTVMMAMVWDIKETSPLQLIQLVITVYTLNNNSILSVLLHTLISFALAHTWYSFMSFGIQWQSWEEPYRAGLIYHRWKDSIYIYVAK